MTSKKTIFVLIIIVAVAAFFRLWQLDAIPPGIYPDEAMNANDAITAPGNIFYPANNGREGGFINLIALSFAVFGVSVWSFKFVSAAAGILTVIGIYFLAKEIFKKENKAKTIALFSSFFLAVSFWHINFSRIGFRAILVPLILTLSFYFLLKGFKNGKISSVITSGIIFGLGFYSYISFRLAVLIVPIVLLSLICEKRREKKDARKAIVLSAVFFVFVFLTALPIGMYFLNNPEYFISRATGVSVFSQNTPLLSFSKSLAAHLGMFNFRGDGNWRHNFSGSPQIFWPVGILFLVGLTLSIKKSLSSASHLLLLSWFFIMLLPGVLTYEGIPHALRTIGVIPPAYILAGLGGWRAYEYLTERIKNKKLFLTLCWLFVLSLTYVQFGKYFLDWAKRPEVSDAFTKNYTEIGRYLNSLPEEIKKYVIVNEFNHPLYGISIPSQTPMFIERTKFGSPRAEYITAEELNKIERNSKAVIVPLYYQENLQKELEKKFPEGRVINKYYFNVYIID